MSNITAYPLQDWFETTLAQSWNGAIGTVYLNTAPSFTFPSGVKTYIVVNPWKTNMQVGEIDSLHVWNKTVNVSSISVGSWAGTTYTQESHSVWSTVIISDNYQFWKNIVDAVNSKIDWLVQGIYFYADATARDAALWATPSTNGLIVGLTSEGKITYSLWGAWIDVGTWATFVNASTTVAGKVEIATTAESQAGTDTGGTGALLSVLPSDIAKNTQSSTFIYGADVGGDDTYVVALTPTLAAYTTGQILTFKATTANTGACTIDFWPWAKSIKTEDGNDPANGEVRAGVNIVQYDGTNFVLHANTTFTPSSNIFQSAIYGETITAWDVVHFQNDGKVYKWDWYASASSQIATPASFKNPVSIALIDTNKAVAVYGDWTTPWVLYCRVWTISWETITWGAQTTVEASVASGTEVFEVCSHDTNAFTVAFWDSTTLSVIAATVSWTTPTFGSKVTVNATTANALLASVSICSTGTGKICVAYVAGAGSPWINGRVGTISGTTITLGAEAIALASNGAWAAVCKLDTDKVLLWGIWTGSDIVSYVGSISGTVLTFWAQAITAWTCTKASFIQADTNVAVVSYVDTTLKGMYVTSSGTANTHRTAVSIYSGVWWEWRNACMIWTGVVAFLWDASTILYTAYDATNYTFNILNTITYSITWSLIYWNPVSYTLNRVLIGSVNTSWADVVYSYFLNNNVRYLYGIAQESGVLDEVKKVAIPWNITTSNSGLITGEKYYTTLTWWYTLNPTTLSTGVYVGKALSATSMLVWINNSTL